MSKEYSYKGYIIQNIPYMNEARWFISNEDGSDNERFKYPKSTLKEAKESIDNISRNKNLEGEKN